MQPADVNQSNQPNPTNQPNSSKPASGQLTGKVALITGGTSGIGLATARLFVQQGAKVGILGRSNADVGERAADLGQWGEVLPLVADVSDPTAMYRAAEALVERWGTIDTVFANAGINGVWAPVEELTLEEWERPLAVNLTGTFLTIKYTAPYLKRQGGSIIINSSVNGTRMFSNTGATSYACSKAAQVTMAKMLALEMAKFNVRVNAICPGAIGTPIIDSANIRVPDRVVPKVEFPEGAIPLTRGQLGSPDQVAQLVLFLASDASSHITGSEIWIDGGQSLLQG